MENYNYYQRKTEPVKYGEQKNQLELDCTKSYFGFPNIINNSYLSASIPNQADDSLDSFFTDKVSDLGERIESIKSRIEERNKLKEDNLSRLFKDELKFSTYLTQLKGSSGYFMDNKRRGFLEDKLNGISHERRSEAVHCFRDLMFLEKELNESLKEYSALKQRQKLVA